MTLEEKVNITVCNFSEHFISVFEHIREFEMSREL
jgi:hypothetical protein